MTTTHNPHIDQVRTALLATLADLRDRTNPMDIERAKAVANVASVLVDTARVENDYLKITGQDRSGFLSRPDDLNLPGPANGITSITRHQLKG
jgi:hypothetical protein